MSDHGHYTDGVWVDLEKARTSVDPATAISLEQGLWDAFEAGYHAAYEGFSKEQSYKDWCDKITGKGIRKTP